MTHPDLRSAVPEQLASWLDAALTEGTVEFGLPGYPVLRDAWASGDEPTPELLDELTTWLVLRHNLHDRVERAYARLVAVDGFGPDRIPGWYLEPWAQVLLSMPWDERLAGSVDAAKAYVADHP